jgi:2,3-bisphosphoglycerate-independent phosphoglycerate mutase
LTRRKHPPSCCTTAFYFSFDSSIFAPCNIQQINLERTAAGLPPANIILLRGCGSRIRVKDFGALHSLQGACMVAPTKIIMGLGMSVGIERVEAPGAC